MNERDEYCCPHCKKTFTPDRRNRHHQVYCSASPCKAASKKASQAKWLTKNPDYHSGSVASDRVKAWRKANPGYCKGKARAVPQPGNASHEAVAERPTETPVITPLPDPVVPQKRSCNRREGEEITPLQDLLRSQPIVLIGIIAHIWDTLLQEDIASILTRLIQLGQDIQGGQHEYDEAGAEARAAAAGSSAVQLGRSPPGTRTHPREGGRDDLGAVSVPGHGG